ncbi:MAG: hypothetical protein J7M21_05980, partial [Planctomycetes bacterium]|nr:hypothetical protein [Planctomycetota bacterium]
MATYKLNIATVRSCPPPDELAAALADYGLPEDDEFGLLNYSAAGEVVFGTVVRRLQQTVQRLDRASRTVTAAAVEKVQVYPFAVRPAAERLELYAGSLSAIEQMGVFLGSCL